jgi:hypothetical protein
VRALRQDFRERAAGWAVEKLKFLDESGVTLGMTPRYGWAPVGTRVPEGVPTHYRDATPWSMVACIGLHGVHAPWLRNTWAYPCSDWHGMKHT